MMKFKPSKDFFEAVLKGRIDRFTDKRTFAQKLQDLLDHILTYEDEKIESTLLFNGIVVEFDEKKETATVKLCLDDKELFYMKRDIGRIDSVGALVINFETGLMQMTIS